MPYITHRNAGSHPHSYNIDDVTPYPTDALITRINTQWTTDVDHMNKMNRRYGFYDDPLAVDERERIRRCAHAPSRHLHQLTHFVYY